MFECLVYGTSKRNFNWSNVGTTNCVFQRIEFIRVTTIRISNWTVSLIYIYWIEHSIGELVKFNRFIQFKIDLISAESTQ